MLPNLRLNNLFPIDRSADSVEDLYNRFSGLLPPNNIGMNENFIRTTLGRPTQPIRNDSTPPINRYAAPNTTNTNISYGLTPANTQIDTKTTNSINPLDLAKLNLKRDELGFKNESLDRNLNFKQNKQEEDNLVRTNRASIYEFKAKHPGMAFDWSGPTVKVGDKISGEVHDTGIPSGHLSDEDKINLNSTNRINEIGARGVENRNTNTRANNERGANELNNIAARGAQTRQTNNSKPESQTQTNQSFINNAQKLSTDSKYSGYIKLNRNTDGRVVGFTTSTPKGADESILHELNSKIYGIGMDDVSIPSSKDKSSEFNSSTTKLYTDKAGNKYNIPMDKITEFLKDNPNAIEVK